MANDPNAAITSKPIVQDNLGEPTAGSSLWTDMGHSLFGHADYSPGAQYGGNSIANGYADQLSHLGSAQGQYDQNMGQHNGQALMGQGNAARDTFRGLGDQFAGTQAPQINMQNANAALGNQNNALSMYQQAAMGNGPSAAQAQLQSGLQQSIQAQQAQAASTRGGFGLANAQHGASQNAAQLQGNAANQSAQLRAQEQQAGMAGYAGLGSTIEGQQSGNAQFAATQAQNQNQFNARNQLDAYNSGQASSDRLQIEGANLGLGYDKLGQGSQFNYNQLGQGVLKDQLSGDVANHQITQDTMNKNAANSSSTTGGLLKAFGSLF